MKDFSFQGKVFLGTRLAGGKAGVLTWVGDAPKCDMALKVDNEERTESYSGRRLLSATMEKKIGVELSMTLNYFDKTTLELALRGTSTTVASTTVTAEVLPTVTANATVMTAKEVGSALVITDSAGTPATLVAGVNYRVDPNNPGLITFLDLGTFTQPFKAAYTSAATTSTVMFGDKTKENYFLLDGINTVTGEKVRGHLYRVKFNPADNIPFITDGFGQIDLKGFALHDSDAEMDPDLGGFGKIVQVNPPAAP